jgi:putative transcriptional regulator
VTTPVDAKDPRTRERIVRFGEVVRVRRRALGLSQEKLAERAGCDRQTINRVENAAFSPSLPRIFRLADALGVTPADLFVPEVPDLAPRSNGASRGRSPFRGAR